MKNIIKIFVAALVVFGVAHADGDQFNISTVDGKLLRFQGTPNGIVTTPYQGKIVFIEFWGTWCAPCLMSIPHHVKLQEKYKDQLRVISIETTPRVTDKELAEFKKEPWKHIDMTRISWYLQHKATSKAQRDSLVKPIQGLKDFIASKKPINYDIISDKAAGNFIDYIAQRTQWPGYIPFLLVLDGDGNAVAIVPGMPSEQKLENIIQSILSKSKKKQEPKEVKPAA